MPTDDEKQSPSTTKTTRTGTVTRARKRPYDPVPESENPPADEGAATSKAPAKKPTSSTMSNASKTAVVAAGPSGRAEKVRILVNTYVLGSTATGVIPVPLIDLALLGTLQVQMLKKLAALYDVPYSEQRAKVYTWSLLGTVLPLSLTGSVASVVKGLPGIGTLAGIATAPLLFGASTYALSKVFIQHFESGGTLLDFDPQAMRAAYKKQFEEGKRVAQKLKEDQKKAAKKPKKASVSSTVATKPTAKKTEPAKPAAKPAPAKPADLKIIEGIGPKIAAMLQENGIATLEQLAETSVERLAKILEAGGPRYRLADPTSWPEQAKLAAAGDWDALKKLQDSMKAGRRP